jgi:hypothetical protein
VRVILVRLSHAALAVEFSSRSTVVDTHLHPANAVPTSVMGITLDFGSFQLA